MDSKSDYKQAANHESPSESPSKEAGFPSDVKRLLVEIGVGTTIFLAIAFAAVILNILVHYLEKIGIDPFIVGGLKITEYIIFTVDILLFLWFLGKTAYKTWREM